MLRDFDRKRNDEKADEGTGDAKSTEAGDEQGEGPQEMDEPQQVVQQMNPTWRRDPAGGNAPLDDPTGAGMTGQATDQPDPDREGFRERNM